MNSETITTEVDAKDELYMEYWLVNYDFSDTLTLEVRMKKRALFGVIDREVARERRVVEDVDELNRTVVEARQSILEVCGLRGTDDDGESEELELLKRAVSVAEGRDIE